MVSGRPEGRPPVAARGGDSSGFPRSHEPHVVAVDADLTDGRKIRVGTSGVEVGNVDHLRLDRVDGDGAFEAEYVSDLKAVGERPDQRQRDFGLHPAPPHSGNPDATESTPLANTPAAWTDRADTAETPQDAVGWTAAGQAERFRKVIDALAPKPGETLLDYGSGTGALIDHLAAGVEYVGYDFSPGMVARARREHPGVTFRESEHHLRADLVACIGTFNLPGSKAETWHTLRRLWYDVEPRALAVSLYAGDDERCLRYGMDETWRAVGGFSHRVTVKSWRHNDILAVISR